MRERLKERRGWQALDEHRCPLASSSGPEQIGESERERARVPDSPSLSTWRADDPEESEIGANAD